MEKRLISGTSLIPSSWFGNPANGILQPLVILIVLIQIDKKISIFVKNYSAKISQSVYSSFQKSIV